MSFFLLLIKIVIINFTLYNFFKNRQKVTDNDDYENFIYTEDFELEEYKYLLKINSNFDLAGLKQAYHRMVKMNHPDLFKDAKDKAYATQKMIKLNEAYRALSEYLRYRETCFV